MSLESILQTLQQANIQPVFTGNKISGLNTYPSSTLTGDEAWALIEAEGLRWYPAPDPLYIEWRETAVLLADFRAVINAIFAIDPALATGIMIAFSKVEEYDSLNRAIGLWNAGVNLITVTSEQISAIQEVCDQYYIPLIIRLNGDISI